MFFYQKSLIKYSTPKVLIKVFQSILIFRLKWYLENKRIFPDAQHDFGKGKSTLDNLTIYYLMIFIFLNSHHYNAFLELRGAFDHDNFVILRDEILSNLLTIIKINF